MLQVGEISSATTLRAQGTTTWTTENQDPCVGEHKFVATPHAPIPRLVPFLGRRRFDSQPFRVFLLRLFWLPLPSTVRICRCGPPLDSCGHHHAACSVAGVLGTSGFRSGKCGRTCLSRGRGQSVGERSRAGHGTWPVQTRWTTALWRQRLMGFT